MIGFFRTPPNKNQPSKMVAAPFLGTATIVIAMRRLGAANARAGFDGLALDAALADDRQREPRI